MIEVSMSRNDSAGLDSDVVEKAKNSFRLVARVDDQRTRVRLQDVAVGLQAPHYNCMYLVHPGSVATSFRENMNLERHDREIFLRVNPSIDRWARFLFSTFRGGTTGSRESVGYQKRTF